MRWPLAQPTSRNVPSRFTAAKMKRRARSHSAGVPDEPDWARGQIGRADDRADAAMPLGLADLAPLVGRVDRLEELPSAADRALLERGPGHSLVLDPLHQAGVYRALRYESSCVEPTVLHWRR